MVTVTVTDCPESSVNQDSSDRKDENMQYDVVERKERSASVYQMSGHGIGHCSIILTIHDH